MAVAEDADIGPLLVEPLSRLFREPPALEENMPHRNGHPGSPDDPLARESTLLKVIDVSRNCNDRRNPSELQDDIGIADIAGMENGRHAGKVLDERRIEEPMRIGNHPDAHDAALTHGTATG